MPSATLTKKPVLMNKPALMNNKPNAGAPLTNKQPAMTNKQLVVKKYLSGQNAIGSGFCISTELSGKPCMDKQTKKNIPYCDKCIKQGDPSLGVVPHPRFGRMLIARRALPAGYRMGLFGELQNGDEMPSEDEEWGFETTVDDLTINPCKFAGSFVQFSQCPGPHEKVSITFAPKTEFVEKKKKGDRGLNYGTMMFWTVCPVPKNGQLNMIYSGSIKETNEFFEERGITRCDVYTKEHPTILRQGISVKDLMTMPPKPASDRERIQIFEAASSSLGNAKFNQWDVKAVKGKGSSKSKLGKVEDGRVKWKFFDETFKEERDKAKKMAKDSTSKMAKDSKMAKNLKMAIKAVMKSGGKSMASKK